jgi:hypothetical protein
MIDLPPWDDSMSDGCSAIPIGPRRVRRRFNRWLFARHPGASAACLRHDRAYYAGGSREDREMADLALVARWGDVGVPEFVRVLAFRAIRIFGSPVWRTDGVSWGFGGARFRYDEPADGS